MGEGGMGGAGSYESSRSYELVARGKTVKRRGFSPQRRRGRRGTQSRMSDSELTQKGKALNAWTDGTEVKAWVIENVEPRNTRNEDWGFENLLRFSYADLVGGDDRERMTQFIAVSFKNFLKYDRFLFGRLTGETNKDDTAVN